MLLHAPRKTAINEAIPRLAAVRAPPEPIMFSPKRIRRRIRLMEWIWYSLPTYPRVRQANAKSKTPLETYICQ